MAEMTATESAEVFRALTAIKLLRHKAERTLNRAGQSVLLDEDDVNEILVVAGFPEIQKRCREESR